LDDGCWRNRKGETMNKQQIEEIRKRYERANWWRQQRGYPTAANVLIGDIPALLDYIEELEKQLHPVGNGHDDWIKEYYPENDNGK